MKKILLLHLLFYPFLLFGQININVEVNQPPPLDIDNFNPDTTIIRDGLLILGTEIAVFGGSEEYTYNWSPGNSLNDSTILNPVASPVDSTVYTLTVTDKSNCSVSTIFTVNVRESAVNNTTLNHINDLSVRIYPNPNPGTFKLELNGKTSEQVEIYLFNTAGQIIQNQIISKSTGLQTETIETSLPNGVYQLGIKSDNQFIQKSIHIINR